MIVILNTSSAPAPKGHYSQGIVFEDLIFTSIQLPSEKEQDAALNISEQAQLVLNNILNIVKVGGGDSNSILRMTIYIEDIAQWDRVNEVYKAFFGNYKPARGVVAVSGLHGGFKVAMDAVAGIKRKDNGN